MKSINIFLALAALLVFRISVNAQTVNCNGLNQWQPFQRYDDSQKGTLVTLNGFVYQSQYYTYNQSPDVNNGPILPNNSGKPWFLAGTCTQPVIPLYVSCTSLPAWSPTISYSTGQLVTYNNISYSARWGTTNQQPNMSDVWLIQGTCQNTTLTAAGTFTAFTGLVGSPSSNQTFTVTGSNLSGNVIVTAPDHFEVSTAATGPFSSTLQIIPAGGHVSATVYIRYNPSVSGAYTGQVVVSAAGAVSVNLPVSGNGTGIWQVNGANIFSGNTGNVGIGVNPATQKLDVLGNIKASGDIIFNGGTSLTAALANAGQWSQSGNNLYYSKAAGNVGIGVTNPASQLTVLQTVSIVGTGTGTIGGELNLSDAATTTGGEAGGWSVANNAGNLKFFRGAGSTNTGDKFVLYNNGDARLQGKLATYEVFVTAAPLTDNFPDYVFEPAYRLLSLDSLEKYIDAHKHLPEVPAASAVKQQGRINLGEMNNLLLKKVEELTLYTIEQQKTARLQQQLLEKLARQNQALQKRMQALEKK